MTGGTVNLFYKEKPVKYNHTIFPKRKYRMLKSIVESMEGKNIMIFIKNRKFYGRQDSPVVHVTVRLADRPWKLYSNCLCALWRHAFHMAIIKTSDNFNDANSLNKKTTKKQNFFCFIFSAKNYRMTDIQCVLWFVGDIYVSINYDFKISFALRNKINLQVTGDFTCLAIRWVSLN